ncbi:MAG: hypothetical protein FJZ13_02455 [Candidatus Omnitrophica bacterium]|nr:hypothetical protein [Candidatus Omnitrophota bacterium]
MKQRLALVFGIIATLILMAQAQLFSQDAAVPQELQPEVQGQWVWGDIVSVDIQKNEILLKYLDYDTEQEKEMAVSVNDKTRYENAKSLLELKPQDTVSIDYTLSPEGKNIAQNINVEKPEEAREDLPPAETGN